MNVLILIWRYILSLLDALRAISCLLYLTVRCLFGKHTFKMNFSQLFDRVATQRLVFSVLRIFKPNLSLAKIIFKSYHNTGTVLVTRRQDVLDVLSRNADFEVTYGSRMKKLTDGDNFFLGMQPSADYQRNVSMMRLAARQSDVSSIVVPRAKIIAQDAINQSKGKIDLPTELTKKAPWDMVATYFGTPGENPEMMQHWATTLFWYLFNDVDANDSLDKTSLGIARDLCAYLDKTIQARKDNPNSDDDLINRCLSLQTTNPDIITDINIRNNLLGLIIGAIPTISKACCFAIDELFRRPEELEKTMQAARNNDDDLMAQYLWEALRFNPLNPIIFRRAARDTTIARTSLRQQKVKQGQMVLAANLSATFDRKEIPSPNDFLVNREWETYITWGYGMHKCFGATINKAIIPTILKPLLCTKNLRRAPGKAGKIDTENTPFPMHFHVEFDVS